MLWGSFGVIHLVSLAVSAGIIFGLYFLLKALPEKVRYWSLFLLSLAGIAAIIFNLVAWDSPLEYLPFHMCSITAMLLPVVVLTRNKYIGNLLLVWCLGAILALVMNQAQAEYVIPSATFFFYFVPHTLEFAVTVYLFKFGYIKKDYKCIPSTVGITVGIYTVVHIINLALNHYCAANQIVDYAGNVLTFNYMFSMTPTTPIFELFWKIIPFPYWYMYVAVVILVAYLAILYAPQIVRAMKEKNRTRK
ncbi:MAG: hypothetical protein E7661_08040 [Ruminococcaceae bacterium]|nr:hypothetical protein [Oscillospiraceae bacterium]